MDPKMILQQWEEALAPLGAEIPLFDTEEQWADDLEIRTRVAALALLARISDLKEVRAILDPTGQYEGTLADLARRYREV